MEEKKTDLKPNLRLFAQLSPNISAMHRATNLSRPCIYNMLNGAHIPRKDSVVRFNTYLHILMQQRLRAARSISQK